MSATAAVTATPRRAPRPWALWLRQLVAVSRLELRRRLMGRRALGLYLVALLPVVPLVLRALYSPFAGRGAVAHSTQIYAVFYQTLVLRVVLFLGTASLFVNLFRGDELERVLHLYFLSPIRREVLAVAKYCAGVLLCGIPFSLTTIVAFLALYLPHGLAAATDHSGELLAYLACTWLAVAGYGAVAVLLGLLVKNAMLPVLALWGWEWLNPVLPELLKKMSVLYWVQSLPPVLPASGPLAVIVEPAPTWVAVTAVLALALFAVAAAAIAVRRHEVRYAAD